MLAMMIFVLGYLISGHPEFFHAFSFVHQFYFWNRITWLIIILLFFGCCWPLLFSLASSSSLTAAAFCCCSSSSTSFSTMSFNLLCPYPILSIILLYNEEAVSRTLCSLSAGDSRVCATGADTALCNFEIVFLKNELIFY